MSLVVTALRASTRAIVKVSGVRALAARILLDFGDTLLHGIEVGRVVREVTGSRPGGGDRRHRLGGGVKLDVAHPDLLAQAQTGHEELLHIARKDIRVYHPSYQKRRTEPVHAHSANDGEVGAAHKRFGHHRPLAARRACVSACHSKINPELIPEDQSVRG